MTTLSLPQLAAIMPLPDQVIWVGVDGDIEQLSHVEANQRLDHEAVLYCHQRWCAHKLGRHRDALAGLDLLELFAFVRPARFAVPTAAGLAANLGLASTSDPEDQTMLMPVLAHTMLEIIAGWSAEEKKHAAGFARLMAQGGWGWAPMVMAALGEVMPPAAPPNSRDAAIWTRLDEIADDGPAPPAGNDPINYKDTQKRLNHMLGRGKTIRPGQMAYAESLIHAFTPPHDEASPHLVMAEAGTGTGKTVGYLAPASLWAETNAAPVWISTYTRSLQHQIESEMARLYDHADEREKRVVIRKGRENYLCLLNLEEALTAASATPRSAIALGLMARWAEASGDGDMTGAHFPAWLSDLFGYGLTQGLSDRRGECIHSACVHYRKCYVEKNRARAAHSDIVIANHALVMVTAVMNSLASSPEARSVNRYVFDEGHHLFDAADSAFSTAFTGAEAADLRRWIRGGEDQRRGNRRLRGIRQRLGNLLEEGSPAMQDLEAAFQAAAVLPATGWRKRLTEGEPDGLLEQFFYHIRQVVYDRIDQPESLYSLEAGLEPIDPRLAPLIAPMRQELAAISIPLTRLAERLKTMLADESDILDTEARQRLESAARGLIRRASGPLAAWINLLDGIGDGGLEGFVDWMEATRRMGEDVDVGIHRHWIDPSLPFHDHVLTPAKGVVITSATLTDRLDINSDQPDEVAWANASRLTGASHLDHPPQMLSVPSPFDYAAQARVFIVTDCDRNDPRQTSAAMAMLMMASGGGALGLFTAINRLKAIYPDLAQRLTEAGLPLYAQHIDAMNLNTLIQIFRSEPQSCLLGTDAIRDGIDVPGEALRLIAFDRVPWPRPDMLFKARSEMFGREAWTERLTRMKLRQAFGRLIRRETDRGVFVMLDNRLPTRLTSAFPAGTPIIRCGLAEAIHETREFLKNEKGH
jgi:ATP-dependent DNA helicase DinG